MIRPQDSVRKIIDISPPLTGQTAVWPGDTSLQRAMQLDLHQGDNLTLSALTTTVHIGAHADAPSHYTARGATIDEVDLAAYIGPCTVVSCCTPQGSLIRPDDCIAAVQKGATRILFRTLSQPDWRLFPTDFIAFTPEALAYMGSAGVRLVGIDTPSVDPFASKALLAHQELQRHAMYNLEGLVLHGVQDGDYELIALPLKLAGFDASPVRAILRTW